MSISCFTDILLILLCNFVNQLFGQFSNYTSKSPFYRWLVMRSRLGTWETMLHWGSYMGDLNYSFYKKSMERRARLCFQCPLTKLNINCTIRGKWWVKGTSLQKGRFYFLFLVLIISFCLLVKFVPRVSRNALSIIWCKCLSFPLKCTTKAKKAHTRLQTR